MYDFHTHTFLSDGVLAPTELIGRAHHIGYRAMAITDHVGPGNLESVLKILIADCKAASDRWDILALPGVEITYAPKEDIDMLARDAKAMGAKVVNVHGETIVEPVPAGTNMAAVRSPHVDILAHPGLVTAEEAQIASSNGVFFEVSARAKHGLANGHVVRTAQNEGVRLVLNSDAHEPGDLMTREFATRVLSGAGLNDEDTYALLETAPQQLLSAIGISH